MARLLSVSRAAHVVGVPRAVIQKQIRNGELTSFEGEVNFTELTSLYPDTRFDNDDMPEKIEEIIANALRRARYAKLTDLVTPDTATLAARVSVLSKELSASKIEVTKYERIIQLLKDHLAIASTQEPGEVQSFIVDLLAWMDSTILNLDTNDDKDIEALTYKDDFLRIMAAQVHIKPSNHEFFVEGKNSILESGLSAGYALDYGCSSGNCGKCKAKLVSGRTEKIKHHDYVLTEAEKAESTILMCSHTATTDIELEAHEAGSEDDIPLQNISAKVKKVEAAGSHVSVLTLKAPRTKRLRFFAGQSAELVFAGLPAVTLPIASCPCDERYVQFHIHNNHNVIGDFVKNDLKTNDTIKITGPQGHFVLDEESYRSIILLAENTGFAPVKSLIEHALTLEISEFIHLYWLANEDAGHYLSNHCRAWNDALDDFSYTPIETASTTTADDYKNYLFRLIKDHRDLMNIDFYLCGSENLIDTAREFLLSQGVPEKQIRAELAVE